MVSVLKVVKHFDDELVMYTMKQCYLLGNHVLADLRCGVCGRVCVCVCVRREACVNGNGVCGRVCVRREGVHVYGSGGVCGRGCVRGGRVHSSSMCVGYV